METTYKKIVISLLKAGFPEPDKIAQLPGDASNRSYYRVFLPWDKYPTLVIMVMNNDSPAVSEEIEEAPSESLEEIPFLNVYRLLKRIGVSVPEIVFYFEEEGIMGLEDVGDCLLEKYIKNGNSYETIYEKAIDTLVLIHSADVKNRKEFLPFRKKFGSSLFFLEFNHYLEYGLLENGFDVSPSEREALLSMFHTLSSHFTTFPYCLTHRDYHSRNILVKDNEIKIIDFQDALLAPWHYDLASLLKDAYVELEDEFVKYLLDRYITGMERAYSVKINKKKFSKDFELIAFHRNLKAIGRFYYIKKVKGKGHLLKYVPTLYRYVEEYLEKHSELSPLGDVLKKNSSLLKKLLVDPS